MREDGNRTGGHRVTRWGVAEKECRPKHTGGTTEPSPIALSITTTAVGAFPHASSRSKVYGSAYMSKAANNRGQGDRRPAV